MTTTTVSRVRPILSERGAVLAYAFTSGTTRHEITTVHDGHGWRVLITTTVDGADDVTRHTVPVPFNVSPQREAERIARARRADAVRFSRGMVRAGH